LAGKGSKALTPKTDQNALADMLQEAEDVETYVPMKKVYGKAKEDRTNFTFFVSKEMNAKFHELARAHNTSVQQLLNRASDLLFSELGWGKFVPLPVKDGRGNQRKE